MSRKEPISKPASYITSGASIRFSSPVQCLETPQESPQNIIRLGLPTHARRQKLPSGMFNHVAPMDAGQHGWSPNMIPICVLDDVYLSKRHFYIIQYRKHKHISTQTQTFTFHATNMQTNTLVVGHPMDPPSAHPPLTFRLWHPGGVVGDDAGIQDAVEHFLTSCQNSPSQIHQIERSLISDLDSTQT